MKKLYVKVVALVANPKLRPAEIWLFRAVAAYVAVRLGITVDKHA